MSLLLLLVAGATALPACPDADDDRLYSLAMTIRGHSVGGLAAVSLTADGFTLAALSPAGPELFTVRRAGTTTTVSSPLPEWTPWLERLPFERDLRLVSPTITGSCARADGRIRVVDSGRRWRGHGGPARAAQDAEGRWVLHDPWRGYTLILKEAG